MYHTTLPDELTEFIPEKYIEIGLVHTWRLVIDEENDTVEMQTQWTGSFIRTIIGIVTFFAVGFGGFFWFFQPEKLETTHIVGYILISGFLVFLTVLASLALIIITRKNTELWKAPCRFRFDKNTKELFFSREEKRYGRHDYRTVLVGITTGYNYRDMVRYTHLAPENLGKMKPIQSGRRSPLNLISQLYLLIEKNDGTWARHLVAHDENVKPMRRAAQKLADMLECRQVTRDVTSRECGFSQLPDAEVQQKNKEVPPNTRLAMLPLYAVGGLFILIGLGVSGLALSSVYQGHASKSWPTCEGTVVKSEVNTHQSKSSTSYEVKIRYSYTVSGRTYMGDRYFYQASKFSDSADAKKIVAEHPAGSPVTVYYSPDNPKTAVLIPGVHRDSWYGVAFGICFALIAVLFIVIGSWSWNSAWRRKGFAEPKKRSEAVIT